MKNNTTTTTAGAELTGGVSSLNNRYLTGLCNVL